MRIESKHKSHRKQLEYIQGSGGTDRVIGDLLNFFVERVLAQRRAVFFLLKTLRMRLEVLFRCVA